MAEFLINDPQKQHDLEQMFKDLNEIGQEKRDEVSQLFDVFLNIVKRHINWTLMEVVISGPQRRFCIKIIEADLRHQIELQWETLTVIEDNIRLIRPEMTHYKALFMRLMPDYFLSLIDPDQHEFTYSEIIKQFQYGQRSISPFLAKYIANQAFKKCPQWAQMNLDPAQPLKDLTQNPNLFAHIPIDYMHPSV